VATANQDPFPPDYAFSVAGDYADKYRIQQIRALLGAKPKLTVDDMLAIQKDVYAAFDYFLAQQAIAAASKHPGNNELVRAAIDVLRSWNGQMDKDEAAPMITELFDDELGRSLVILVAPGATRANIAPRPQVIETLLRQRPRGWVANDDWDTWLMQNFDAALQEGRRRQGNRVSSWRWGLIHEWNLTHPVGKELPIVNRFFDIGPIAMSGSGTTVKQTTISLGPSERMVVDLGDLDKSLQNLLAGESGFVASGHYKDQWQAYYTGKSFPMQFDHVDGKDVLHVRPQ
jgi:penicillin amidase